jgi:pyruvate dehydrogenase complex dehydrogenase (E1) component
LSGRHFKHSHRHKLEKKPGGAHERFASAVNHSAQDPQALNEWRDALASRVANAGPERACQILDLLAREGRAPHTALVEQGSVLREVCQQAIEQYGVQVAREPSWVS